MKILLRAAKEAGRYKWYLFVAAISTVLLTALNLIAPKLLTTMISAVGDGVKKEELRLIFGLTAGLFGLYLLKVLFRYLSNYMAHKAAWRLVQEFRMKVFGKLLTLSMRFFRDKQTGELMSRVINDTSNFEQLFAHIIPESITNIITLAGVTTIIFTINAKLALFTCIPIPFILASGVYFSKKVRPNFRTIQRSLADLNAQLQDEFSGIQEVQAFSRQEKEKEKVNGKASVFTNSMLRALNLSAVFHPSVEFLTSLGTVIVVGFGGYLAYLGKISVSEIVGFLLYLSLFYAPITGIANLLENVQNALAGAERVFEILDMQPDIEDLPGAETLTKAEGHIEFRNVDYRYIPEVPVLNDISFEARPGQMIALVGATGVGKTTIIQLAARFYDPCGGAVLLDGKDIRNLTLGSVRGNISPVLQDTFLFNGTIAENISFGMNGADMKQITEAATIAGIHDDIINMPDGYETKVGERGTKLSGGQKQRIAIARAVLQNAPVLILDEATASVDVETEKHIQKAIAELSGKRTIIAIAHRLSTIKKADIILVLENGRITERGTHEELMDLGGAYKRMWSVQAEGARL